MKNFLKILLPILVLLLIIRLALPYILMRYVEYEINKQPDYHATIADIDIHLIQGEYVIKGLKLEKMGKGIPVPFFSAKTIDYSVDWSALVKGSFTGELIVDSPKLNFVVDPKGQQSEQLTLSRAWLDIVKALFPLNFNKITINQGEVHYRSFTSNPPFDVYIRKLHITLTNMRNADKSTQALPSTLTAQAITVGDANVDVQVKFNPFLKQPTFAMSGKVEKMDLSKSNNFLQHYTKLQVRSGVFSLYMEAAAKQGKITGYVKPLIKNLEIADEPSNNPVKILYKGAVKAVAKMLENSATDNVATKITIKGNIDDPNMSIWSLVVNILRNAFIQALLPQLDHSIDLKDIQV